MKWNQRGFSLVELVVVVSIVSIAVAMGVPNFLEWRKTLELRDAASEVSAVLMEARTKSIIDRRNYTVTFDAGADTYTTTKWLAGATSAAGGTISGRAGNPWRSVDIYDDDTDPVCPTFSNWDVVFRPNSTADTADYTTNPTDYEAVYLRDSGATQRYRVKVLGVTGRITVERWMGGAWTSAY
jgi:prepilin-type N-terminal cleavage/methylation domain-containing protein